MPKKLKKGVEPRSFTISFRVTGSFYEKVMRHVDASSDKDLSDYARKALLTRIAREEKRYGEPISADGDRKIKL